MEAIYNVISGFTNWLWGVPLLILLVGGGIILSVIINGIQFVHLPFIFKNTIGTLFNKEEQKKKKAMGVTPYQAVTAALGATVGTGNIVGVGTAIALGGPGALFWMWVCGFLAMGIKYSEVTMSVKYREKQEDGSYRGGPFMYMKDGLHCMPVACLFGVMMLLTISFICCVHSSAITSNLASIGVPSMVSCIVMVVFMGLIIMGGMKTLVKITDKMVPIMAGLYLICSIIVIFANIGNIGTVFASIFTNAFTGTAAVGGFTGAVFSATLRNGLARGVFSNDAGLGLSASIQAQAEGIDHPAQQGMWAVIETFVDTILICTLTGLMILFTGVWTTGEGGATLAATALGTVLGRAGTYGCIISLVLFGISSLISDLQGARIQAVAMFRSDLLGRVFQILIVVLVVIGSFVDISKAFMLADFGNGIVLLLNVPSLILLGKILRSTTKEWFDNGGDMAIINAKRKA